MDSKTLKALQFFYDRGPTPFLKLNSYLGEFSAEYRYLLATGMIERTHCGQMVEVTIAGRDAYERNNPSSKVNVISWIAIVLQFLNMILSPHDYSIPQMIKDCIEKIVPLRNAGFSLRDKFHRAVFQPLHLLPVHHGA